MADKQTNRLWSHNSAPRMMKTPLHGWENKAMAKFQFYVVFFDFDFIALIFMKPVYITWLQSWYIKMLTSKLVRQYLFYLGNISD